MLGFTDRHGNKNPLHCTLSLFTVKQWKMNLSCEQKSLCFQALATKLHKSACLSLGFLEKKSCVLCVEKLASPEILQIYYIQEFTCNMCGGRISPSFPVTCVCGCA